MTVVDTAIFESGAALVGEAEAAPVVADIENFGMMLAGKCEGE